MQRCCQTHNRLYGQLRWSVEIPCLLMVQEGGLGKYTKFHDPKIDDLKIEGVQEEIRKYGCHNK